MTHIEYGYVIKDTKKGFEQFELNTFSSNRADAWDRLCGKQQREWYKKNGFRCVYVERTMSDDV